jgi:RimJ/RimL family protein N-acetyltransferase
VKSTKHTVKLSPATHNDLELIMAWRSHPNIYHYFKQQNAPLTWEEHSGFWHRRKNREDFIVELRENGAWRKVGTINVNNLDSDMPEIGILIGELTLQGKGVGGQSLKLCLDWLKIFGYTKAKAVIHTDNKASQQIFLQAGFKPDKKESTKEWHCLIYEK